jgi:hypothetical protein
MSVQSLNDGRLKLKSLEVSLNPPIYTGSTPITEQNQLATKEYVDANTGGNNILNDANTWTQLQTFNVCPVFDGSLNTIVNSNQLTTKAYVDNHISGVNVITFTSTTDVMISGLANFNTLLNVGVNGNPTTTLIQGNKYIITFSMEIDSTQGSAPLTQNLFCLVTDTTSKVTIGSPFSIFPANITNSPIQWSFVGQTNNYSVKVTYIFDTNDAINNLGTEPATYPLCCQFLFQLGTIGNIYLKNVILQAVQL